mmetsp:Transcript_5254/g.18698  ORF Transcript_5254/g.18698 Transcript_5254/m.18698 type:complete len:331 (-) Transcript_5254:40-1032(-)
MASVAAQRSQGVEDHMKAGPSVDVAMDYLHAVEKELSKNEFSEFLETIEEFKHQKISTQLVVKRIKKIFSGKSNALIVGFNLFLPVEHHIKTEKYLVALDLVKKIRDRFEQTKPGIMEKFVSILGKFQEDSLSLDEAKKQVKVLFRGHHDLLQDFDDFLPLSEDEGSPSASNSRNPKAKGTHKAEAVKAVKGEGSSCGAKRKLENLDHCKSATVPDKKLKDVDNSSKQTIPSNLNRLSDSNKRRLTSINRLQQMATEYHSQKARKQQEPRKLANENSKALQAFNCRPLIPMNELLAVIPTQTIGRVQAVLRNMQSNQGVQGCIFSFVSRG